MRGAWVAQQHSKLGCERAERSCVGQLRGDSWIFEEFRDARSRSRYEEWLVELTRARLVRWSVS